MNTNEKYEKLKQILEGYGKVAIAFSGGVDSSFLLRVAHDVLGDEAIAITIESSLYPERETSEAVSRCNELGVRQLMLPLDEFEIEGFDKNPVDRCYICKTNIFKKIISAAAAEGIAVVAEGSNVDDEGDYRPGLKAITEQEVKSPLRESGLTKDEIRILSKELSLPTWDKPSFACLATRFPYGDMITKEKLQRLDLAEQLLIDLGFSQVRVRLHGEDGSQARIEALPEDFPKMIEDEIRNRIYDYFREIGFENVSLDMRGYKSGSMNEGVSYV